MSLYFQEYFNVLALTGKHVYNYFLYCLQDIYKSSNKLPKQQHLLNLTANACSIKELDLNP